MILDQELRKREANGRPIQVALVGAGAAARMIALQLLSPPVPGLRLAMVTSRHPERAAHLLRSLSGAAPREVATPADLEAAIAAGQVAFGGDPAIAWSAPGVEVILEATGSVEYGAQVALGAFQGRKHLVLVNAELDGTLGPVLGGLAAEAGVVFTDTDGDEPGVAMNLLRYLRQVGLRPVAAGNMKGMLDPYRTPDSQHEFAERHGLNPRIATAFADGTKLSLEAAVLANATGFGVLRRGMLGPRAGHVREMAALLPPERLLAGGLVDFALGAEPGNGAFVVVHEPHPEKQRYLSYLKMGPGPFYTFYTPYHLPHIQVAATIARAAILGDSTVSPAGRPVCEVVAVAKRDLSEGEELDGIGGFCCYGEVDNAAEAARGRALPIGLAEGCRMIRPAPRDAVVTLDDVEMPRGRISIALHSRQRASGGGL